MDEALARRLLQGIVDEFGRVPVVRLPMRGRRADRLVRRLEPYEDRGLLAWILCTQLACTVCLSRAPYRVERGLREVYDRLSGLRYSIPWAQAHTDSGPAWKLRWRGDIYEVEWLGCGARLSGGRVECLDREVCSRWGLG